MKAKLVSSMTRLFLLTLVLFGSGAAPVRGADTVDSPGEKVSVRLRAMCTPFHEGVYAATRQCAQSGADLAVGETGAIYIGIGRFDADGNRVDGQLQVNSVGTARDEILEEILERQPAPDFWWADLTPIATEIGEIELEVRWYHIRGARRDVTAEIDLQVRRISLSEKQRHVLDYIGSDEPASPYTNVSIELTAEIAEDPRFAGQSLSYDLWHRHTTDEGDTISKHVEIEGGSGAEMRYGFEPLRFPANLGDLPAGTEIESILEMSGVVQGRLRPDGTIEIRLAASRWIDAELAGTPRRGGIGDGGEKIVSVSPGETISLVLPEPGEVHPEGRCGVGIDLDGDGATSRDETVWVHNGSFYSGHRDELILTVNRGS